MKAELGNVPMPQQHTPTGVETTCTQQKGRKKKGHKGVTGAPRFTNSVAKCRRERRLIKSGRVLPATFFPMTSFAYTSHTYYVALLLHGKEAPYQI